MSLCFVCLNFLPKCSIWQWLQKRCSKASKNAQCADQQSIEWRLEHQKKKIWSNFANPKDYNIQKTDTKIMLTAAPAASATAVRDNPPVMP